MGLGWSRECEKEVLLGDVRGSPGLPVEAEPSKFEALEVREGVEEADELGGMAFFGRLSASVASARLSISVRTAHVGKMNILGSDEAVRDVERQTRGMEEEKPFHSVPEPNAEFVMAWTALRLAGEDPELVNAQPASG